MPVPSSISDLSTTPSLNSPAGTESPSTVDDYLRTFAAFIKQVDGGAVKAADLAATGGAALVGYDGGTAQDVLDDAKPMADYTALRSYTGRATGVRITQTGIAGFFQRDDADTTSADNGGTIIVDGAGRRWTRRFTVALNVMWFGAKGDGTTDDTAAIQLAINHGATYIPLGTYRVTSSLVLPSNAKVRGAGINKTVIKSDVIGDSLFKTTTETTYINLSDMTLEGNNLTGASGNGHAINFIDPVAGGAWSPQQAVIERLRIRRFRGQDVRALGVSTTIAAAGIIMVDALQNVCRDVMVDECGHGFYMVTTQNCRIENCVGYQSDKYALIAYDNENLIVESCDLLNAGDGVVDPGYPATTYSWGSGVVLSYKNKNFVIRNSKLKNIRAGNVLIRSLLSFNDVYDSNWIRADATTDVPHKAIYALSSYNLQIINNVFHPSFSGFGGTRKYEQIELYNTLTNDTMLTRITGNTFGDVSGMNIAYNIKVGGNSNLRTHQVVIEANNFGFNEAKASACVVDADILIENCALVASSIKNNLHIASANVTRTVGVSASNITDNRNTIGPSRFSQHTGTITSEYSGIGESVLWGAVIYTPPSLVNGARATTTVSVPGVSLDYPDIQLLVTVGFSKDLAGVRMWGYVSAIDTVTVVFENNTGGTVGIASGSIYAKAEKFGPPAI